MKNKKNLLKIAYIALALLICVIPFACMTFARTDTTTENKRLKAFPRLKTEDGWNVDILSDLGGYFEDHFAFRNEYVTAMALIESALFGVSSDDGVVAAAAAPVSACGATLGVCQTVRVICGFGTSNFINMAKGRPYKKFIQYVQDENGVLFVEEYSGE